MKNVFCYLRRERKYIFAAYHLTWSQLAETIQATEPFQKRIETVNAGMSALER